jgi:hypothetical protein
MRCILCLIAVILMHMPAFADERTVVGGDAYVSGSSATLIEPSPRDAFLSGFSADLMGKVERDANAFGFNVDIDAPVGGDLYAAGFSVKVAQPVGEDLTASGFNIYLRNPASIGGNARLAAGTIVLDGPVAGSLVAAAGTLTINQPIAGDARLTVGKLIFGPNAKIGGTLTYFAPAPIDIPSTVASADRVKFEKLEQGSAANTLRDAMGKSMPRFWPSFLGLLLGFVLTIAFLVAIAAVLLAVAEKLVETLRQDATAAPFRSIVMGLLGMGMLVGLVPVVAMTLIGIPLIPFVMLAAVALWVAGYLLGIYATTMRVIGAFREAPNTLVGRILAVALGLVAIATLNFVPVVGWLVNLAIVFLGLGAIFARGVRALADRKETAIAAPIQPLNISGSQARKRGARSKAT